MRKPKLYQCRFCTTVPALRFRQLKAHERSNHPLALKADKAARKAQRDIYDQARLVDEWPKNDAMPFDAAKHCSTFNAQLAKSHQDFAPITITIVIATHSYLPDRNRSFTINETYRATVRR